MERCKRGRDMRYCTGMEDGLALKGSKGGSPSGDGDGAGEYQDEGVCEGVGMESSVSIPGTQGTILHSLCSPAPQHCQFPQSISINHGHLHGNSLQLLVVTPLRVPYVIKATVPHT